MQPPWIEYIFMHIYTLHYFTLLSLCNVKLVVNVTVKRQGPNVFQKRNASLRTVRIGPGFTSLPKHPSKDLVSAHKIPSDPGFSP